MLLMLLLKKLYCNPRCTKHHKDRMYRERYKGRPRKKYPRKVVRVDPAATHPCRKCGENTAKYRQVLCDLCKAGDNPRVRTPGVGPLRTRAIDANRQHEAEMIELVVAKALANGNTGPDMFKWHKRSWKGVQIG